MAVELSRTPARPSRRARATPTSRATSSATACGSSTRSTASGEPTVLLLPTWSIIHSRHWKMQIPYLARHCRVRHLRRARQRPLRPPAEPDGVPRARSSPPTRSRSWTRPAPSAPCSSRSRSAPSGRCSSPPSHPERVDGRRLHRAGRCRCRRPCRAATPLHAFDERARHRRGLGEVQPPLLARATTRASSSSSSRSASPSRTRRSSVEDCVGWGARDRRPRRWSRPSSRRRLARRGRRARARSPRVRLPGARDPRHRRRDHARATSRRRARRADRRRARRCSRAPATSRTRATRSRSTCCCATSSRRRRRPRALGARQVAPQARALRLLADRPRPRAARRRDRRRAAQARTPTSRSTGSPSTRSPRCSRRAASGSIRRARYLANESRHIESESAEHDLHCFQAIRRMDEILLANFMVFHDLVRDERLRPLDRRRGVGARLLPAREPGAEARRLRLADRLRRLAADGRRRRRARRS